MVHFQQLSFLNLRDFNRYQYLLLNTQPHMAPGGITQCFIKWDITYCWEKLIQVLVDILLIIITSFQLYLHCKAEFGICRVKYWLYYLIILTTLCHLLHQLIYGLYFLFDFSTFFFNIYFTTLLYYAAVKLLEKTGEENKILKIVKWIYWLTFVIHFVLLVLSLASLIDEINKCVDIWYLVVRTVGVVLAVGLFAIGKIHENRANKKISEIGSVEVVHNPMPRIWCWVSLNIIAQFINLIRTFIFAFVKSLKCEYDKDNIEINYLLELISLFIIFYMPMFSTIFVFWKEIKCNRNRGQSFLTDKESALQGMELMAVNRDSL